MNELDLWLKKNQVFGLELPSGWFGRPYDNHHRMTWFENRPNKLILELDEQLYLVFTKPLSLEVKGNDLVISGFSQLAFDRQGYGDKIPSCKIYNSGSVKLVSYGW